MTHTRRRCESMRTISIGLAMCTILTIATSNRIARATCPVLSAGSCSGDSVNLASNSTISGGASNQTGADYTTIGGGDLNLAGFFSPSTSDNHSTYATISGGYNNSVTYSIAGVIG